MSINDIKNMPMVERMQLMEALLDSFCQDDEVYSSPEWHKEILDNRSKLLENEDVKTYTLDEVLKLKEKDWFSRGIALSDICNSSIFHY